MRNDFYKAGSEQKSIKTLVIDIGVLAEINKANLFPHFLDYLSGLGISKDNVTLCVFDPDEINNFINPGFRSEELKVIQSKFKNSCLIIPTVLDLSYNIPPHEVVHYIYSEAYGDLRDRDLALAQTPSIEAVGDAAFHEKLRQCDPTINFIEKVKAAVASSDKSSSIIFNGNGMDGFDPSRQVAFCKMLNDIADQTGATIYCVTGGGDLMLMWDSIREFRTLQETYGLSSSAKFATIRKDGKYPYDTSIPVSVSFYLSPEDLQSSYDLSLLENAVAIRPTDPRFQVFLDKTYGERTPRVAPEFDTLQPK